MSRLNFANKVLAFFLFIVAFDLATGIVRHGLIVLHIIEKPNPTYFMIAVYVLLFGLLSTGMLYFPSEFFKTRALKTAFTLIFIGIFGVLVGLLRQNDLKHTYNDAIGFLAFPIFGIALSVVTTYRAGENSENMLTALLKGFWYVSLCVVGLYLSFFLSILATSNLENSVSVAIFEMMDNAAFHFDGKFLQFFAINTILLPSLLFLGICFYSNAEKKSRLFIGFVILLILTVILVTYVRMTWLSIIMGVGIFVLYSKKTRIPLIVATTLFVGVVMIIPITRDIVVERVSTVFDQKNLSNQTKLIQIPPLLENFADNPIVGNGFGMHSKYFTRDDPEKPYLYEVEMIALLAKLGMAGYLCLYGVFLWILLSYSALTRYFKKRGLQYYSNLSMWGFISVLIIILSAFTNPYFSSALGISYFMFFVVILDILTRIKKDAEMKNAYRVNLKHQSDGIADERVAGQVHSKGI